MPSFSEAALAVLAQRYLRHDEAGRVIENPAGMFERVATAVAEPASSFGEDRGYWAERFLARLSRLEFLPNSPTLMNAGLASGQLAACFVLPVHDDLDSIFATLALTARIHQTGGGTGFSFSGLRPSGDRVRSTGGVSSGPLSFMEVFDHTTSVIREGGRRRGANMAVLRVDHPDIEEFINAKRDPARLTNFNLSVGVTDAFFAALEADERFALRNPRTRRSVRRVKARAIFEAIVEAAWAVGDPGLLYLDEINRHNPTPALGPIEATNPCGEQPLLAYESCTLGSLNLRAFVLDGDVDWERFRDAIRDAVVFLDNVVEANVYPAAEIREATLKTRKIGLGVMGLADLLGTLGIPYDSPEALAFGMRVASFITSVGHAMSGELGERRGIFPAFKQSLWPERGLSAMRNATVSCVAPTGTLSLLAGVAGGIEPFFALATERRMLDDRHVVEVNRLAEEELEKLGPAGAEALAAIREHGSLSRAANVPAELKRRLAVALEISPEFHVRMQAAFQQEMDAGVSKTVNLPPDASPEAVRRVFMLGRTLKLKGVTVYRYGSRPGQVLSLVDEGAKADCRECAV
jgi:ribonucleoside-diphosphate reductase alpha chain